MMNSPSASPSYGARRNALMSHTNPRTTDWNMRTEAPTGSLDLTRLSRHFS